MRNRKVYCNDCWHFMKWSRPDSECGAPDNSETYDTPCNKRTRYTKPPKELNANNNCPYYKSSALTVFAFVAASVLALLAFMIISACIVYASTGG